MAVASVRIVLRVNLAQSEAPKRHIPRRRMVRNTRFLFIALALLSLAAQSKSEVATSQDFLFTPSTQPDGGSGVTMGSGQTFQKKDGVVQVIPSDNGVPVGVRPGLTVMSPLIFDSTSATMNITTQAANISTYVVEYQTFLDSGGEFNLSLALEGSTLLNISTASPEGVVNISSATTQLTPDKTYVLVVGDATDLTNATYKLTSAGTKTLPSGQVVTATLSPGNLAALNQFTSTGTASLDLQVQMQNSNANGAVTVFAADQAAAIQIVQSNNPSPTSNIVGPPQSQATPSPVPPTTPSSPGPPPVPTQTPGIIDLPPTGSPDAQPIVLSLTGGSSGGGFGGGSSGGSGGGLGYFPRSSLSNAGNPTNRGIPTLIELNSAITIPVGQAISAQLNLKDFVGEVFLLAFYDSPDGVKYTAPGPGDATVTVTASYSLSSTVLPPPENRLLAEPEPLGTPITAPPLPTLQAETPPPFAAPPTGVPPTQEQFAPPKLAPQIAPSSLPPPPPPPPPPGPPPPNGQSNSNFQNGGVQTFSGNQPTPTPTPGSTPGSTQTPTDIPAPTPVPTQTSTPVTTPEPTVQSTTIPTDAGQPPPGNPTAETG